MAFPLQSIADLLVREWTIRENLRTTGRLTANGRYYRDSTLQTYNSFPLIVERDLSAVISGILSRKESCRILEVGCGDGVAAQEIRQTFGPGLEYSVVAPERPVHAEGLIVHKNDI